MTQDKRRTTEDQSPRNTPGRANARRAAAQRAFQARLLQAVGQPLAACDAHGRINYWNAASERLTGWPAAEVMGRMILDVAPNAGPAGEGERILAVLLRGEPWNGEYEFWDRSRKAVTIFVDAAPVKDDAGALAGFVCAVQDIGDRRLLRQSENLFRALFEMAADAIFVADPQTGRILDANRAAQEMIGRPREEILRMNQTDLHPPEMAAQMRENFAEAASRPGPQSHEFQVVHRDGSLIPVEISSGGTIVAGGRPIHFGIFRDISARKAAEAQTRASLAEKEVLLREVHHRVKNNLQTVLSLAQLQARGITDPAALRGVRDLQERIRAIAIAHENLYQSGGLSSLRVSQYLQRLAENIFQVMGAAGVRLRSDIEDLCLPVDKAVPVGLIVTELLTNALRHAFDRTLGAAQAAPHAPREIRLSLALKGDQCEVLVADSGFGLPAGLDWRNPKSLGLLLVNRLSAQLRGSLEVVNDPGAAFTLRFPAQGIGGAHDQA